MGRRDVVYIHYRILLRPKKKKEILPPETMWMDLVGIILSEINQTKTNVVNRFILLSK